MTKSRKRTNGTKRPAGRKPAGGAPRAAAGSTPRRGAKAPVRDTQQTMTLVVVGAIVAVVVAVAVWAQVGPKGSVGGSAAATGAGGASALSTASGAGGTATVADDGWIWNDPAGALALAAKENKPVLVDFWASWCVWCIKMDEETYPDPAVQAAMKAYVPLKIDVDKLPDFQKQFKADGLPTTVVLDPSGKEIGRVVGYQDATRFAAFLKDPGSGGRG